VAAAERLVLIAVLFREGTATRLVARMQPLRAFQIVYLVMVLALGAKLANECWAKRLAMGRGNAAAGRPMLGASAGHSPTRTTWSSGSAARNQWVQAFVWVAETRLRRAVRADADLHQRAGEDAQCFGDRGAQRVPDYSKDGARRYCARLPARGQRAGRAAGAEPEQQDSGRRGARASLR